MMMNGATETERLLNCTDTSVLEGERAHLKYHHYPGFDSTMAGFFSDSWTINGGEIDGFLGTTETDERLSSSPESKTTSVTFDSVNFKKRKLDNVVTEIKILPWDSRIWCNEKKMMMMNNESTKSIMKMKNKAKKDEQNCSNDSSKVTKESQKTDYIHVRARRGQATDSRSIAERARREKISERMKYLQALVPGCDKITSKAGTLDEIINYVLSLQRQVEFLSMKLAAVSPSLVLDIHDFSAKDVLSALMANLPSELMPSHEIVNSVYPHEMVNFGYPHINLMQQVVTSSNPPLPCFNNGQAPSMWESDVQNLYSSLGV